MSEINEVNGRPEIVICGLEVNADLILELK